MLAQSLGYLAVYLAVGLLTCWVARKGWPDDWDEALLASVLGPPLVALVATLFAADVLRAGVHSLAAGFTRHPRAGQ